jgi:hypothetical protein
MEKTFRDPGSFNRAEVIKEPWKWSYEQQNAFNTMKKIMAPETIMAHPNFEIPFHRYTLMQAPI